MDMWFLLLIVELIFLQVQKEQLSASDRQFFNIDPDAPTEKFDYEEIPGYSLRSSILSLKNLKCHSCFCDLNVSM